MGDPRTLPALLAATVERAADAQAFAFPEARWTYAELDRRAREITRALLAWGIGPGDRVGVLMPNCLEFMAVDFGVAGAGAALVAINARYSPREIAYVAADAGLTALVTIDGAGGPVDLPARLRSAWPELAATTSDGATPRIAAAPSLRHLAVLGAPTPGFWSAEDVRAAAASTPEDLARDRAAAVRPGDAYIMLYTSGTSAEPKGCPLTHEAVVRLGLDVGRDRFRLREGDGMWNPLPMFHVSMQAPMIGVVDVGGLYASMTHFDPGRALQQIRDEDVAIAFPAYPTILQPLVAHPDYDAAAFSGLRGLLCVGPPDLLRRFQAAMPDVPVVSCYGSTELAGIAVMGRLEDPEDQRVTCGKPLPGVEVEIRDLADGAPAAPDTTGVIHVRGYNLFPGYHNDPAKTAEAISADGWFDTGDLGSLTADGSLMFAGRVKDMLKVGGENVAAVEVESFLSRHPAVAQCAVVGRPDAKYEEVPVAFVELAPGAAATPDELIAHCAGGLARYKVPREVRFVTEWPMSATKIQKFRLKQQLLDDLATSA